MDKPKSKSQNLLPQSDVHVSQGLSILITSLVTAIILSKSNSENWNFCWAKVWCHALKSSGSKLNAICILNYLHHKNAGVLIGQELNCSFGMQGSRCLLQSRMLALGSRYRALFILHIVPNTQWGMGMDKTCQMSRLPGEILLYKLWIK